MISHRADIAMVTCGHALFCENKANDVAAKRTVCPICCTDAGVDSLIMSTTGYQPFAGAIF